MTIDWTKPVAFMDCAPVRVERVLANGAAIVSWTDSAFTHAAVMYVDDKRLRNVPPKPREWWIYNPTFETARNVPPVDSYNYTHVREVLEEK